MLKLFCLAQVLLVAALLIVDYFHRPDSRPYFSMPFLFPLFLSVYYLPGPLARWAAILCVGWYTYAVYFLGDWTWGRYSPYFAKQKELFALYYEGRRKFLLAEWEEQVRNILYGGVFVLVVGCFVLSVLVLGKR